MELFKEGETSIHYAAEIQKNVISNAFDDFDILNLLLNHGGDVNFHAKLVKCKTSLYFKS